ncbi:von Willebrand factor A domain-containing protein 7-like isoform X1 [Crassostrea angulata]|uniref:von Willebrand factor A domain-containing protein 7-like isoform X1 n=1 Tax=Magallana angulata TaxID=2784310 RepID=UPI0022B16D32|nr:von Willebrand factor A domain-containing protein 7-like isoform X1 [Crassostrea angulata]
MKHLKFLIGYLMFLVSLVDRSSVSAFPPQTIYQESSTKSHADINFYAIFLSTHQFLLRNNFVNGTGKLVSEVLGDFFGRDRDSLTIFHQNIHKITDYQNIIQRELVSVAHYHVNGEQILTAHNYIRSLRRSLIDLAQSRPDIDILRERVGQCLYTLQQFYSNTNWVELHGDTIIKEFGISAALSVSISNISDEPCSDCPTDLASLQSGLCKNNTRTTYLTSGYKSEQDVSKPPSNNQGIGKCSHGSQDDTSRLKSATGGIYKGRSSSAHAPHFHLHYEAFEAAKLATVYFLSDENDGLFSHLGIYLTKEVFQIKSKKENKEVKDYSITFVIDVTGSMSDNIAGVIQGAASFVDQIRQSERIPEKYILVTFSDPVDLEKIRVTNDADEMISWINGLTVSGGGDCPEYSLSGLIAGATFSNHNSTIYIYTDAPAKDESRETEVIEILQRKSITPKFRLRPECGTRRKRDTDRYKRQSSVYDSIAQATGGDVERFSTSAELADKVQEDLMSELLFIQSNSSQAISQNNLPSSISIIKWRYTHTDQLTYIEVDNSVDSLRIEINGTSNSSEIHLRNPNGLLVDSGSRDVTLQYSDNLTIFLIESPSKGLWTLENIVSNPLTINITANSSFDISSSLREISSEGFFYPLNGNPVSGKEYVIVVLLENLPANFSISSIVLVDEKGNAVTTTVANLLSVTPNLQYFAKTKIFKQIAGVQIHGQDSTSQQFIRTCKHTINPVDVTLKMKPFIGDLSLSNFEQLEYNITNHGGNNRSLTLDVSDDKGYIVDNRSIHFHISPGESENKQVFILGTQPSTIVTVTASLKDEESHIVLQKLSKKLTVSSAIRPTCNLTSLGDICQNQRGNGSNCYDVLWQGSAQVNFSGIRIASLDVSSSSVNLTHGPLWSLYGPLEVTLKGDCCTRSIVLTATDNDGFIAQCRLQLFRDDSSNNVITDSSEPIDKKETVLNLTILGAAIGGALAGIVIFTTGVLLKIRHSSLKSSKVKDDTDMQTGISMVEQSDKNKTAHFRTFMLRESIVSSTPTESFFGRVH